MVTIKTAVLIIGSEGAGARVAQGDHDDSPQAFLEDMVIKDLVTRKRAPWKSKSIKNS